MLIISCYQLFFLVSADIKKAASKDMSAGMTIKMKINSMSVIFYTKVAINLTGADGLKTKSINGLD